MPKSWSEEQKEAFRKQWEEAARSSGCVSYASLTKREQRILDREGQVWTRDGRLVMHIPPPLVGALDRAPFKSVVREKAKRAR